MRALRVIFSVCLIFALAGSVFAKNDKGNNGNGNGNGGSQSNGQSYAAPGVQFSAPLKYELLILAGGAVLLLERPTNIETISAELSRFRHRHGSCDNPTCRRIRNRRG